MLGISILYNTQYSLRMHLTVKHELISDATSFARLFLTLRPVGAVSYVGKLAKQWELGSTSMDTNK